MKSVCSEHKGGIICDINKFGNLQLVPNTNSNDFNIRIISQ